MSITQETSPALYERSPHTSAAPSKPARRPLIPLLLVLIGAAMYFSAWLFPLLPPGSSLAMPMFMAAFFGPMLASVVLGIWWLALGHGGTFGYRFVTFVLVASLACNAALAANEETRGWLIQWGLPGTLAVMVVTLWVLFHANAALRYTAVTLLALAAVMPWELGRIEGVTGEFGLNWHWRFSKTKDELLAEHLKEEPKAGQIAAAFVVREGDWPGFRGPGRDGRADSLDLSKLKQLWAHPVGAGWGSVAGVGERLYTQEQRDKDEVIACYDLITGREIWAQGVKLRFAESVSGPGPRGTPTFDNAKVYAIGATGVLVCRDANSGQLVWKQDITKVLGEEKTPLANLTFGQSCSPLVMEGKVFIHPGVKGSVLAAFDAKTGAFAWKSETVQEGESYSSPQHATLAGKDQVLVFGSDGLTGHDPTTGAELWRYAWSVGKTSQPCVQPTLVGGDRVVIGGATPGMGMRCVKVTKDSETWSASEVWKEVDATPRFNDVVLHKGHLFGIDGGRLFCIDAETGELAWKGRNAPYGTGQVMLVGDKLVVVAEKGFVSWMNADPTGVPTAQKLDALKDKTWNHPAVVRGRLLVRNAGELMCFGVEE